MSPDANTSVTAAATKLETPRVSVIIPHLNTPDLLAHCLESVTAQRLDHGSFEVIVADNGSRTPLDGIKAVFPDVTVVVETAPGPGLARNLGIAFAKAPVLAFIDADCRAETGWLQAAVDAVEGSPVRTIIGGDVRIDFVDPQTLTAVEAYEAVFSFRQKLYIEKQNFSGGGNLAAPASVFADVGPFGGIGQAEDNDWGLRAYNAGFPVRYAPAMRIYHPARKDFDDLKVKWRRMLHHLYNLHIAVGSSRLNWQLRAFAMIPSIPIDSYTLLTSDRLSGFRNRLRGISVLTRIRVFRAVEMTRLLYQPDNTTVHLWNRQP